MKPTLNHLWDKLDFVAIGLSVLCAIHCFLTPLFLIFFPMCTSSCCEDDHFHKILFYVALPLSSVCLFTGCRRHLKKSIFLLGILGLSLIGYATFGGDHSKILGEKTIITLGGVILAFTHVCNLLLCHNCSKVINLCTNETIQDS